MVVEKSQIEKSQIELDQIKLAFDKLFETSFNDSIKKPVESFPSASELLAHHSERHTLIQAAKELCNYSRLSSTLMSTQHRQDLVALVDTITNLRKRMETDFESKHKGG